MDEGGSRARKKEEEGMSENGFISRRRELAKRSSWCGGGKASGTHHEARINSFVEK